MVQPYSFSSETPFKESTRIAGVLQKADIHGLKTNVLMHTEKDMAVSWIKDGCQFHLLAKHRLGSLSWHLFYSKGLGTAQIMQTNESNINALFEQIAAKTNEVSKSESLRITTGKIPLAQQGDMMLKSAFQTQISDADWIAALVADQQPSGEIDEARSNLVARAFLQDAFRYVSGLASLFNELVGEEGPHVTLTDMGEIEEKVGEFETKRTYARWRAATAHWSLSARAFSNTIELFLVHSSEAVLLSTAETDHVREMKLTGTINKTSVRWWNGRLPVSADEMKLLAKASFAKLVKRTMLDMEEKRTGRRAYNALERDDQEKQLLAQKIITQQEQLQKQIARDLHDAVIADITVLKRGLTEDLDKPISTDDIVRSLDEISTRLREICYDLSPTDLRDWGLKTTLEALLDQASSRTNAKCKFECPDELPELDGSIDLHIFRILQEAISNVIKYAKATEVSLNVEMENDELVFNVVDNGKGIDFTAAMKQARQGGMGMTGMQERVGIIRSYYPATLTVRSKPGRGTLTRLAIQVPKAPPPAMPKPAAKGPSPLELLASED